MEARRDRTSSTIVLVLEEDDARFGLIKDALADTREPVALVRARSRSELLRGLQRRPALLVTGPSTPGLDPLEALKLATGDDHMVDTVIVAQHVTAELSEACLRHGAADIQPLEPAWRLARSAERLLRVTRLTQQLQDLRDREANVLAAGSDLHLICDVDTRIRWLSDRTRRALTDGLASRRLEGTLLSGRVVAADIDAFYTAWESAVHHGRGEAYLPIRASGETLRWEATITDLREDPSIRGLLVTARDTSQQDRTAERLASLLDVDQTTQVGSITALVKTIGACLRTDRPGSLVLLRLSGLRAVNGSYGYRVADQTLREMAERLTAAGAAEKVDATVYRLFGNVLGMWVPGRRRRSEVAHLCHAAQAICEQPIHISPTRSVNLASNVAAAFVAPEDRVEATAVIDRALAALADAVREDTTTIYDQNVQTRQDVDGDLLTSVISAMDDGRIGLHYQPILDLDTGLPVFIESLMRLYDTDGRPMNLGEVLPLAKRQGLLLPLERQVAEVFAADVPAILKAGPDDLEVSLNVSDDVLASDRILRALTRDLEQSKADTSRVLLELRRNHGDMLPERLRSVLLRLAVRGIRVVWDNLESASVPIRELAELDIDTVKVRIPPPHDARGIALVRSLTTGARELGLRVVGMHVGDDQAIKVARSLGLTLVQGFAIAKPMTLQELLAWQRSAGGGSSRRSA